MKMILGAWLLAIVSLQAKTEIQAFGEMPSDTRDQLGDTIGGIGSGLVYDTKTDTFFCIADRGPGDGTLPYRPRYVKVKIKQDGKKLIPEVVESVLFRDAEGREMTGLIPNDRQADTPRMKDGRTSLDPEAIALAPDGTLYVTDEYGPYLYQFQQDGKFIRRITLPEAFRPKNDSGKLDFTPDSPIVFGRNINQGPEGLSLLPDGKTAVLAFQSGLMQQGGHSSPVTNLLFLDLTTGKPIAQYLYSFATQLPGSDRELKVERLSVNDILTLDATRFLVLERDGAGRDGREEPSVARYKAVWLIDTTNATNVLETDPADAKPVEKQLVFNLPALVPDPKTLSAKWEGIALLAPPKGRDVELMMTADNDFLSPVIHHDGQEYPFPRAKDTVPGQFFKIKAELPEKSGATPDALPKSKL